MLGEMPETIDCAQILLERNAAEYRALRSPVIGGCSVSTGKVALNASIWPTSKFDTPTWRIFPSATSLPS
jgi:hypothetical protein